jgi:CrcB protein
MPEAVSGVHVLWTYVLVFIGGGIGSALRHACNRAGLALIGPNFPAGTLFVNIAGCLLMGLFAGWFAFRGETTTQDLRLFLATGVCGGFTTFSAFSLDAVVLWQRGDHLVCAVYVGASFVVALLALLVGLWLVRTALAS